MKTLVRRRKKSIRGEEEMLRQYAQSSSAMRAWLDLVGTQNTDEEGARSQSGVTGLAGGSSNGEIHRLNPANLHDAGFLLVPPAVALELQESQQKLMLGRNEWPDEGMAASRPKMMVADQAS